MPELKPQAANTSRFSTPMIYGFRRSSNGKSPF
jgi:hypothetical protein